MYIFAFLTAGDWHGAECETNSPVHFAPNHRMTSLFELQDAVRAEPERWAAWLVLADWLLEHGDIRGELIQHAHSLEQQPWSRQRRAQIERRMAYLTSEHQAQWAADLDLPGCTALRWQYGFVVAVKPDGDPLPCLRALLAHPSGGMVSSLDLSRQHRDADSLRAVVSDPIVRKVTRLHLNTNDLGVIGAKALAESPCLGALTHLDLSGNPIGDTGLDALAHSRHLHALRYMSLAGTGIGAVGLGALAVSPGLPALSELVLRDVPLSGEPLFALISGPRISHLRTLALDATGLRDADIRGLSAGPLPGLTKLGLCDNWIGSRGACALAEAQLPALAHLDLARNRVGDEGALALAHPTNLPALRVINVWDNLISHQGATALEGRPGLRVAIG